MSGSGRKTNYRKGVTKKVLYDAPEPKENEQIVQVVGLRGSNLFEVRDEHDVSSITMLPTKFRKLIWIKRGDFLIVASGDAASEASTAKGKKKAAVTSIVEHILYKDQIKHLKAKSLWPEAFDKTEQPGAGADDEDDDAGEAMSTVNGDDAAADDEKTPAPPAKTSNGITMLDTSFANMMHLNPNRRHGMFAGDEDDDDDEDSD